MAKRTTRPSAASGGETAAKTAAGPSAPGNEKSAVDYLLVICAAALLILAILVFTEMGHYSA